MGLGDSGSGEDLILIGGNSCWQWTFLFESTEGTVREDFLGSVWTQSHLCKSGEVSVCVRVCEFKMCEYLSGRVCECKCV